MKEMPLGAQGVVQVLVTEEMLATHYKSGEVAVFATPHLVLVMEEAAVAALRPYMEPGETTVGSLVNIRHLAPTPPGFMVTATARLLQIDGRRLVFQVEASDGIDKVGDGTHERFLVSKERFNLRSREKSTRRNTASVE